MRDIMIGLTFTLNFFPGGELSQIKFLKIASQSNLNASGVTTMANSYAKTLEIWFNNFQQKWSEINEIGFDDKFKRTGKCIWHTVVVDF